MKDGPGFAYPKVMRTQEECEAIGRAVLLAFPKFKAEVSETRFYLDGDSNHVDGHSLKFYDPAARCHGSYWRFPVSSKLQDAYERECEAVSAMFVRALCALGKGYTVGSMIANHGLDVERLAEFMVKAGAA